MFIFKREYDRRARQCPLNHRQDRIAQLVKESMVKLGNLSKINTLITDQSPPKPAIDLINLEGINLMLQGSDYFPITLKV